MHLPANVIGHLIKKVIDQFKSEYKTKTGSTYGEKKKMFESELFGYSTNLSPHSIWAYLNEKIEQKYLKTGQEKPGAELKYFKIEQKYLWKKKGEVNKALDGNVLLPFDDDYLEIALEYINLNLKELYKDFDASFTYYVGYYFSFSEFSIKTLLFKISEVRDNDTKQDLEVEGIHAKRDAINMDDKYKGKIWEKKGLIYGNAEGQTQGYMLNIVGSGGDQLDSISKNRFIKVLLQGVTYGRERFFGWEAILCKIDNADQIRRTEIGDPVGPVKPDMIGMENLRLISMYLTLHRNVVAPKREKIESLEKIAAKDIKIKNLYHLQGTYRLWNLDFDFKNIIQSKFKVLDGEVGSLETIIPPPKRPKYEADNTAWTPANPLDAQLKRQNALINISRAHDNRSGTYKVVVLTFNKIDIVTVAMFDLPPAITAGKKIIKGSFSSLSDQIHGNISGYFVMVKEPPLQEIEVIPIPLEKEALKYARENNLLPLLDALLELNETNQKKHIIEANLMIQRLKEQVSADLLNSGRDANRSPEFLRGESTWEGHYSNDG